MGMWIFWFIAIVPISIAVFMYILNKNVVWWEAIAGTVMALALAGVMQFIAHKGMTEDHETWSGKIDRVIFHPEWIEQYWELVSYACGTDSEGNTTYCTRLEDRYRTHYEYWEVITTLRNYDITKSLFNEIKNKFGDKITTERPNKSGFYDGDPNIYVAYNHTGYVFPVNDWYYFENRVKASPSIFSYDQVPDGIPVFDYPKNRNFMQSDRLLGEASKDIDLLEFDRMNSRLGPSKKVNVIIVGFGGESREIAQYQESKWIGGRKNDLVICYGSHENNNTASWCHVFGWSEEDICKRNIETIFLNNQVNTSILTKIEAEIQANYVIKDWSKFDYLTINPPTWSLWIYFFLLALTQGVFWYFAHHNSENKYGKEREFFRQTENLIFNKNNDD